jgi:putative flippase GtrA
MATLARFIGVGLLNTAFGFAIILIGLWLGAGDYLANALSFIIGLPVSYTMHRRLTFSMKAPATLPEGLRFAGALLFAYGVNLSVIYAARRAGFEESPVAQAIAITAYAGVMFILSRSLVFRNRSEAR